MYLVTSWKILFRCIIRHFLVFIFKISQSENVWMDEEAYEWVTPILGTWDNQMLKFIEMNLIETESISNLHCVYAMPKHLDKVKYLHIWRHKRIDWFCLFWAKCVESCKQLRAAHFSYKKPKSIHPINIEPLCHTMCTILYLCWHPGSIFPTLKEFMN